MQYLAELLIKKEEWGIVSYWRHIIDIVGSKADGIVQLNELRKGIRVGGIVVLMPIDRNEIHIGR